jgi:dihydrofolate reductase
MTTAKPETRRGKVVVNRSMSLDGFIAGPGDSMDWIFEHLQGGDVADVAAETGAMLVGRRTYDVGARMRAEAPELEDYPATGPTYLLTHRPPDPPDPNVIVLSGDIGDAVATALAGANGRNVELLGADVARQALDRGLVDELLVYLLPVLLGDGVRFSPPGSTRVDLEPISSTRSGGVTTLRFRVRKPAEDGR